MLGNGNATSDVSELHQTNDLRSLDTRQRRIQSSQLIRLPSLPSRNNRSGARRTFDSLGSKSTAANRQAHIMSPDLETARDIVRKYTPFVGGDGLLDSIAKSVAEGISVGRNERTLAATSQDSPSATTNTSK
jgi:hypothetical protein